MTTTQIIRGLVPTPANVPADFIYLAGANVTKALNNGVNHSFYQTKTCAKFELCR